ncbi:MAG: Bax inhibitor-1/YccA family protein [Cyanobacteria bacterium SZAS LIN-2]|nr:Bax inhibitor-1/YccA family protein [Cyanobacteria bacterium SZAS LIN-3]MBS1997154.1 Bax inhibitor-1/YccA family protein [Cyanobacteria bacterium SZAS LIN-2]
MNNPGITLSKSGLFSKVSLLLTISLGISALGTYMGQGITSTGAIIALAVLFIFGSFGVRLAAKASTGAGIAALSVWTFISGLFIGPAIHHYVQSIGLNTVLLVYIGSAGVMSACGAIGALSGINFSRMGRFLMFALLGLIVVGIVSIFVPMSTGVNIAYCLIGMTVFALFFVFDFFRLANSEDTWDAAFDLTMNIYLDYVNFVLYALRFAEIFLGGKSSKD